MLSTFVIVTIVISGTDGGLPSYVGKVQEWMCDSWLSYDRYCSEYFYTVNVKHREVLRLCK